MAQCSNDTRLGGFHIQMSYLGAMSHLMSGCTSCWKQSMQVILCHISSVAMQLPEQFEDIFWLVQPTTCSLYQIYLGLSCQKHHRTFVHYMMTNSELLVNWIPIHLKVIKLFQTPLEIMMRTTEVNLAM